MEEYHFAWFDAPEKCRDDGREIVYHVKTFEGNVFCGADKKSQKLLHFTEEPIDIESLDSALHEDGMCSTCFKILKSKLNKDIPLKLPVRVKLHNNKESNGTLLKIRKDPLGFNYYIIEDGQKKKFWHHSSTFKF